MLNILLIGKNPILFDGFNFFISRHFKDSVIHSACNYVDALLKVSQQNYDLVMLYSDLNDCINTSLLRALIRTDRTLKVLVHLPEPPHIFELRFVKAGAYGYLKQSGDIDQLKKVMETIIAGKKYYSEEVFDHLVMRFSGNPDNNLLNQLSDKEFDVLYGKYRGFKNLEISEMNNISISSVSKHRNAILSKTGVNDISELFGLVKAYPYLQGV